MAPETAVLLLTTIAGAAAAFYLYYRRRADAASHKAEADSYKGRLDALHKQHNSLQDKQKLLEDEAARLSAIVYGLGNMHEKFQMHETQGGLHWASLSIDGKRLLSSARYKDRDDLDEKIKRVCGQLSGLGS